MYAYTHIHSHEVCLVCTYIYIYIYTYIGRLAVHVNQNNEANNPASLCGADIRMTMLPQKLKDAGWETAMFGKWHLGARSKANLPINRGFDHHLGFLTG